jgi:hypothetical protein
MTRERSTDGKRPGSPEPTVKLDLTFNKEAVSRAMKAPKPQEGPPDSRKRQRRGKGEQDGD